MTGSDSLGSTFPTVLEAARAGEARAFERLYELLHRRVYAFAHVRGCADPEGLVNDVFVQVFVNIGTFEGNEPQFKAWVFRIARNRVIDEARRRRRRPIDASLDEETIHGLTSVDDTEREALDRVGSASVLAHLDALTPEQRDVVLLRIVADLTIESIAGILDKRPGAVKALQRRAFRTLAREMALDARTPSDYSAVAGR
ncbi:MAG: RNA polymerase sigma factor [Actinomycetota bacterium]